MLSFPVDQVVTVDRETEQVGGNKAGLPSAEADHANDDAIDGGENPPMPQAAADENGRQDG
jgi:hypothetical protein